MIQRSDITPHSHEYAQNMSGLYRQKVMNRHRVSAMHLILDNIPAGSAMLDIGCGTGHLLFLAQRLCGIRVADGFDVSTAAIAAGQLAMAQSAWSSPPNIWVKLDPAPPPAESLGAYDVVTMVDGFHHIPEPMQLQYPETLVRDMPGGKRLVFMDMDGSNAFSTFCAKTHDLLVNHEKVTPRRPEEIAGAIRKAGGSIRKEMTYWSLTFKSYICIAES
jgi:2-polyprenyl-3-methyl-5-hydroxy-6-metoxy-1,4-benzoquinol methylase